MLFNFFLINNELAIEPKIPNGGLYVTISVIRIPSLVSFKNVGGATLCKDLPSVHR